MKLNELEEVNETIEKCLQDNQFLYRSIIIKLKFQVLQEMLKI